MAQNVLYTSLLKYGKGKSYPYMAKLEGTSRSLTTQFAVLQEYFVEMGEECVEWMTQDLTDVTGDGGDRCPGGDKEAYTVVASTETCGVTEVDDAESPVK